MTAATRRRFLPCAPAPCVLAGAILASAGPALAQYGAADGEWRFYAGDGGHTQYTALDQIDASNVNDLEVAWRWRAENSAERPFFNFESTPIMIGGVLYTSTGASEVAAVDAATGETIWLHTPQPKPGAEDDPQRQAPARQGTPPDGRATSRTGSAANSAKSSTVTKWSNGVNRSSPGVRRHTMRHRRSDFSTSWSMTGKYRKMSPAERSDDDRAGVH